VFVAQSKHGIQNLSQSSSGQYNNQYISQTQGVHVNQSQTGNSNLFGKFDFAFPTMNTSNIYNPGNIVNQQQHLTSQNPISQPPPPIQQQNINQGQMIPPTNQMVQSNNQMLQSNNQMHQSSNQIQTSQNVTQNRNTNSSSNRQWVELPSPQVLSFYSSHNAGADERQNNRLKYA
jgi:hypothetical protein